MSESSENSALLELLNGIEDRRIRRKVKKLLEFGAEAVRSLGELDSALYLREHGEDQMQIVADAVLSHVRRLLEYLASVAPPSEPEEASDGEMDFDFPTEDTVIPIDESDVFIIDEGDMADVFDDFESQLTKTDEDKWNDLTAEMDALQFGLGSELKEFDRRFSKALDNDRKEQALRDLNDATSSMMDGVFAMMTTVYERYLGYVEADRMIPGHRDTLGKAIAVRRGLAELRREVQELNRTLQDAQAGEMVADMSYKLLCESLDSFISTTVFAYLRPSDRKEFIKFNEKLKESNAKSGRLECEGLDKYLDSLAVVSQRDVLIKHDTDLRQAISNELESAIALASIRPQGVYEMVDASFKKADKLFGLIDELDTLAFRWSQLKAEERTLETVLAMGEALQDIVRPTTPPPSADSSDFF